ncbi:MAG: ABC transporter substrate-binding protein [Planctomycetales bacterium]
MNGRVIWEKTRNLALGVSLIVLASAVLLFSDPPKSPNQQGTQPKGSDASRPLNVALFQMASQPILDEGGTGVLDSLQSAGYVAGERLKLKRFNAEGDQATANAIAQELVGGDFDLVITLTTGALQVLANANRQGQVRHVFGLVSDPTIAGVGVGTDPLDHPPHLVGIGTLPPVDEALRMALRLNPRLKRVGMAWNPAEINSEVSTRLARQTCQELNIDLLEANVENAVAVKEAVTSLVDRQVDALLIGGDVTMLGALDLVVAAGRAGRIPVLTCMPGNARRGTLFDLGANYYEVGRIVGRLAARVLDGESIARLPVEIVIPQKLFLNLVTSKDLRDPWQFPPDVLRQADAFIDDAGEHEQPRPATESPPAESSIRPGQ